MDLKKIAAHLDPMCGTPVFLHMEVNPGAYIRNAMVTLERYHVRGQGVYRIYLQFADQQGILHMDDVTEARVEDGRVLFVGYDEMERIARTLVISSQPLSMGRNGEKGDA
ncbi:DUF1806 family protein [Ferroacidibacillus organovorans]|nr:DUF1806 family protein [Ferroacidibacillus organovorans]